jgi:hypothetical protein
MAPFCTARILARPLPLLSHGVLITFGKVEGWLITSFCPQILTQSSTTAAMYNSRHDLNFWGLIPVILGLIAIIVR